MSSDASWGKRTYEISSQDAHVAAIQYEMTSYWYQYIYQPVTVQPSIEEYQSKIGIMRFPVPQVPLKHQFPNGNVLVDHPIPSYSIIFLSSSSTLLNS